MIVSAQVVDWLILVSSTSCLALLVTTTTVKITAAVTIKNTQIEYKYNTKCNEYCSIFTVIMIMVISLTNACYMCGICPTNTEITPMYLSLHIGYFTKNTGLLTYSFNRTSWSRE